MSNSPMNNNRGISILGFLFAIVSILAIILITLVIMVIWPVAIGPRPGTIPHVSNALTPAQPNAPIDTTNTPIALPQADYSTVVDVFTTLTQTKKFVVGVGNETGPYSYAETTGSDTYAGFEVEFVKELARRWSQHAGPITVEFVGLDITRRFTAVKDGIVDFTIAAIPNTAKNCQDAEMICTKKPYITDELKILVRASATQINDAMEVSQFCDYFQPPTLIGFITGTAAQVELPRIFSQCSFELSAEQYKEYTNREQAVQGVLTKEVAGYITHGRVLEFYSQQSSDPDQLKVVGLHSVAESGSTESFPFQVSLVVVLKEDRIGLRDLIDLTLVAMQDDQTYLQLYSNEAYGKYLGELPNLVPIRAVDCQAIELAWNKVKSPENNATKPVCAG